MQVLGTRGSCSENFNVDDFTLSGNLCYSKDNGERLHHTHLQELFNLRWYIQHLIDERGYDDDDDDYLDNPLSEDNWMLQTNRKQKMEGLITYSSDQQNPKNSLILTD